MAAAKPTVPGGAPPLKHTTSALGALQMVFSNGEVVKFPKDALILSDGKVSDNMYRIISGRVRVEKGDAHTPVGQGAVVNQLKEGQTFGEMSFLDSQVPCANCIADSDDVELMRVSKKATNEALSANPQMAASFYKHMAIAVTQRLGMVSAASAEIPEAPRGTAQPLTGTGLAPEMSAGKLLKVRRRFAVPDNISMAFMCKTAIVLGKTRKHGTLYVFETLVGFVNKVFGLKQHEAFYFSQMSELLRESFTLKKEDCGIEIALNNGKTLTLFPEKVEPCYEAIYRCRQQYINDHPEGTVPQTPTSSGKEAAAPKGRTGRRGSALLNPDMAFQLDPHKADQSGGGAAANKAAGSSTVFDPTAQNAMNALMETATLERYKDGDIIIQEGTRHCTLFNLQKGHVAVEVQKLNEETNVMQSVKVLTLYEGAIFGEMSFLNGDVACASVVAEGPCDLMQIKASTIDSMLTDGNEQLQASFYRHLGTYLTHRVRQLTAVVGEAMASRGADIPLEEVLSNGIFFSLFKKFMEDKLKSFNLNARMLDFLTELNVYLDMPANLDQLDFARKLSKRYLEVANGSKVIEFPEKDLKALQSVLVKDEPPPRDLFAPVLSVVLSMLSVNAYRLFTQSSSFQPLLDLKQKEKQVGLVTDYKLLQILGEGYEGKVLQVRKKDCGVCYALKVLDKNILASRSRRWQLHCSRELECLIACSHPYVAGIAYSFQTVQYLYMVLEYLPNHTLAQYLDAHEGRPVKVDEIKFIVAELACGLAHIHQNDIVYRDLKPANVLIDDAGHMRIVDMGMASRLDPETKRRKSVCGTQRYMAPEMKNKQPYNCSVDWYSLGKLILDCQGRSMYAEETARAWREKRLDSLVEGLLVKDPEKRLGCGPNGFRDIQRHPCFSGYDWAVIDMRKLPSPLKPEWFIREPDVSMARQFRNGEDITTVVEKLQAMALDGQPGRGETGPGMVPNWDYVNPRAVYSEYVSSPYLNYKLPLQF